MASLVEGKITAPHAQPWQKWRPARGAAPRGAPHVGAAEERLSVHPLTGQAVDTPASPLTPPGGFACSEWGAL